MLKSRKMLVKPRWGWFFLSSLLLLLTQSYSQTPPAPFGPLPSERQLAWQETEMYCIIHFGLATYANKEWGYGDENPASFTAAKFDADQIIGALKAGGFKGIVLVAKHHDGFCIWPTATTEHNITKAAWKNGKGDMAKEYQLACEKAGIKMGIYCSPWDRNNALYGSPAYVTDVYRQQLRELYANYGKLFMSWHDGANGGDGYYGGSREVRKIDRTTYYGWDSTWAITRRMQPAACIFGDVGPDVRWVGNERGYAGETYWATYTPESPEPGKAPANGFSNYETATEGMRNGKYWMPAECDVPMRPGWFYHPGQDGQSKSPHQLLDLYYKSVGRGACLDLGLSPNTDGQLTAEDRGKLSAFGKLLEQIFSNNLAKGAAFTASNTRANDAATFGPSFLVDDDRYSYWATDDSVTRPELVITLPVAKTFNVIRLRENIKLGQRVESFVIDNYDKGAWHEIASETSIGPNKLIRLPQTLTTEKLRLRITGSPVCIALSDFGLFYEPKQLATPVIERDIKGLVTIPGGSKSESVHFTIDGTEPTNASPLYSKPFIIPNAGIVKAIRIGENNEFSDVSIKTFGISKSGWKVLPVNGKSDNSAQAAIDENEATLWKPAPGAPQEIVVDLGAIKTLRAFTYLPRQDKQKEGIVDSYQFFTSSDNKAWNKAAAGEFSNIAANPLEQVVRLDKPLQARYIKFVSRHVVAGDAMVIAELGCR